MNRFGFVYATGAPVNETRFGDVLKSYYVGCVENRFWDGNANSWLTKPCTDELKFVCKRLSVFDEKLAPNECSAWSEWSECDAVCGTNGQMNRTRACGNEVEVEETECDRDNCETTCPYAYYSVGNSCNCKFIFIIIHAFLQF